MYYDECCNNDKAPVSQWMVLGDGQYRVCGQTVRALPAGAYNCIVDQYNNPILDAKQLKVDDLFEFEDSLSAQVLEEIGRFWTLGERFHKLGFLHRRGYLFHGKQGSGKSSLIHQIVAQIIKAGHLAFFCGNPFVFSRCLERFRRVEPNRPIVCIFEDIDAIIARWGDNDLLQWLDGNQQVDRAVNIASTNYPERLDKRIISRPRRFDRILKVLPPDQHVRATYFARKLPELSAAERHRWVDLSEGLPFAALSELVISVACLGNDLDQAAALLHQLDSEQPSSVDGEANGVAAPAA
jgi:AAA+ superfamily predicted ATPase